MDDFELSNARYALRYQLPEMRKHGFRIETDDDDACPIFIHRDEVAPFADLVQRALEHRLAQHHLERAS